jgi:hypothetical protein
MNADARLHKVTDEEKKQYKDKLKAIAVISNDDDFKKETFYKVRTEL